MKSAFWPFDERLRIINEQIKPGYALLRARRRPPRSSARFSPLDPRATLGSDGARGGSEPGPMAAGGSAAPSPGVSGRSGGRTAGRTATPRIPSTCFAAAMNWPEPSSAERSAARRSPAAGDGSSTRQRARPSGTAAAMPDGADRAGRHPGRDERLVSR